MASAAARAAERVVIVGCGADGGAPDGFSSKYGIRAVGVFTIN